MNLSYRELLILSDIEEPSSEPIFLAALRSSDEYFRWAGAKGLGTLRAANALADLTECLRVPASDLGNTDVHRIACWAIGKIGFPKFEPFARKLARSKDNTTLANLADALGETRDEGCLQYLANLASTDDPTVLLWTCLALSKLGDVSISTLNALTTRALNQNNTYTIVLGLDALKKIQSKQATETLNELLRTIRKKLKAGQLDYFLTTADHMAPLDFGNAAQEF